MATTVWVVKKDHFYYTKGSSQFNYVLTEPLTNAYIFYCKEAANETASKIVGEVVKCSRVLKECKSAANPCYLLRQKDKYLKALDGTFTENFDEGFIFYDTQMVEDFSKRLKCEIVLCNKTLKECKS